MTDDRIRRFAQWQDGLTLDIVEKSLPAIADDLADWYFRNHTPAPDPASFPEALCVPCSGASAAGAANGSRPATPSTPAPVI